MNPESVKGTFGAALAEPTLTRSQDYDGTVTYKSDDESVVKVASDGKLTVIGAGEATITISGAESTYRFAPEAITYGVVIEKASPEFVFAKDAVEAVVPGKVPENKLNIGVYDGKVTYTTSNAKIASVNATTGAVTMKMRGEVTITATGAATANCNGSSAEYKLKIASAKGDMNCNGKFDADDVLIITNAPSAFYDKKVADLNNDGVVNIADIIILVNSQ